MPYLIIFFAIIFLPILVMVSVYNKLQRQKIKTDEIWSSIGALMQQRNDMIPGLVETVKGYAKHEQNTLSEVTRWRNQSSAASSASEQLTAENGLNKALVQVFAVSENYPNLKADRSFLDFQQKFSEMEERISNARQTYNTAVNSFNATIAVFPNNFVASSFNIKPAEFFKEKEVATEPPSFKF